MLTLRQQLRINLNRINSPGFHVIRGGFEGDSWEIRGGFEGDSSGIGLRLEGRLPHNGTDIVKTQKSGS